MPSQRKGETKAEFQARNRAYMNARSLGREPKRQRRRIVNQTGRLTTEGRERRLRTEAVTAGQRRLAFREQIGLWPERVIGLDDEALVKAMRRERSRN